MPNLSLPVAGKLQCRVYMLWSRVVFIAPQTGLAGPWRLHCNSPDCPCAGAIPCRLPPPSHHFEQAPGPSGAEKNIHHGVSRPHPCRGVPATNPLSPTSSSAGVDTIGLRACLCCRRELGWQEKIALNQARQQTKRCLAVELFSQFQSISIGCGTNRRPSPAHTSEILGLLQHKLAGRV